MNPLIWSLALLCGLSLAAIALCCFVLLRIRAIAGSAAEAARRERDSAQTEITALSQRVDALSAQLDGIGKETASVPAAVPRHGLNLGKRAQALRMHRRGDAPSQIAASLEIPLQELDLLIKVHRIVMKNI